MAVYLGFLESGNQVGSNVLSFLQGLKVNSLFVLVCVKQDDTKLKLLRLGTDPSQISQLFVLDMLYSVNKGFDFFEFCLFAFLVLHDAFGDEAAFTLENSAEIAWFVQGVHFFHVNSVCIQGGFPLLLNLFVGQLLIYDTFDFHFGVFIVWVLVVLN